MKPKDKSKPKTIRRPKPKAEGTLTSQEHLSIVADYTKGELTVNEIAKKYSTTSDNVGLIVNRHWKALCNMRESRALVSADPSLVNSKRNGASSAHVVLRELEKAKTFNQEFLDRLSEPDAALLTDEEAMYAWILVHSGDTDDALITSGLDVGLYKDSTKDHRFSYDKAIKIRKIYMDNKPNVVAYIKELREKRLIDADVGKARVQSELLEQLHQMKHSGDTHRFRTQMLKTIELLGKTVGAFTERVEITEVDPANSLDALIEMAQEATVREIEGSQAPSTEEMQ